MSETKQFIYRDARGSISSRHVENVSLTDTYLQGVCLFSGALRTFRVDRIHEHVDQSNAEARLAYHVEHSPPPKPRSSNSIVHPRNTEGSLEVCFTGFKKDDKSELIALAERSSLFIRTSVTTQLDFLCCGYNAGPAKIEKARHQGVVVLNENQFKEMLETG
jgi:NAD-dependent DNA ligase